MRDRSDGRKEEKKCELESFAHNSRPEQPELLQRKIDDLAAKVDLLLKNNQNQIYVMEETDLVPGTTYAAAETETSEKDQQETNPDNPNDRSQGNQFQNTGYQKPYLQNQNQNQNGKIFILSQA
ncbi:hypothetical protein F2Q68_00036387 [Brassica cretica]|uniref:Uncharacterized protein n=1 Tax=Brassica cretica TaxID=69181 RepID=A0A8S9H2W5_BRACR|nr:hypothetical protein F2Q68_00036387 [Brassica cretica]